MKINLIENGYEKQADLLKKIISQRIQAEYEKEGLKIKLQIKSAIKKEDSYQISADGNGYTITASDEAGLYYGIGKFLHTAKWSEKEFVPNPPLDMISPDCSFRAIYFSVHFNNWYDEAPTEELERYLEELLLYGYNAIVCIIPIVSVDSFLDPLFTKSVAKIRSIFELAKHMGMKVGVIIPPNQGMKTAPTEMYADLSFEPEDMVVRGTLGQNLCPSKPGVLEYMRDIWNTEFEQFKDIGLDYIIPWPYDEGGCGCSACRPWGAKGYCDLIKTMHDDAVKYYPKVRFILSTWLYDSPYDQGEFSGLYERLENDLKFVDYIMVDSHDQFPRYPLEHKKIKPIVNFPEISMWKLKPWGGRGANPMPKRFQEIWDSAKQVLDGGMPYSEGMYEDILKIQCVGYYWDSESHYKEILSEYINYEYSSEVCQEVLQIMELIEENHVNVANSIEPNMEFANIAAKLADEVEQKLSVRAKKSWRWRILYIRAQIDKILYQEYIERYMGKENTLFDLWHTPEEYLADSQRAQDLMLELCELYHCVEVDGVNWHTHPPVKSI